MEVAALWKPPLVAAMWPTPAWLQEAQLPASAAQLNTAQQRAGDSSEDSSSGESSSSGGDESSSSEESSGSGDSSSEESSDGGMAGGAQQHQQQGSCDLFGALDSLFARGGGSRRLALDQLKHAAAAGGAGKRALPAASLAAATAGTPASGSTAAATAAKAAAAAAPPSRRREAAPAAGAAEADDVATIGGKRFQRLPEQAGINVWVCQKLASKAGNASVATGAAASAAPGSAPAASSPGREAQPMLGYVCHLKATDQLLLLTNLHSRAAAAQLQQHPALQLLLQQGDRVAGVLHMVAPGVAGSRALRQLCQHLRPAVAACGGQQLLLEQPWGNKVRAVAER